MGAYFRFVTAAIVLLALQEPAWCRVWTDNMGRKVEAEFVAFEDGRVHLKRTSDGRTFEIPLDRLSTGDQDFVRDLASREPSPLGPLDAARAPTDSPAALADGEKTSTQTKTAEDPISQESVLEESTGKGRNESPSESTELTKPTVKTQAVTPSNSISAEADDNTKPLTAYFLSPIAYAVYGIAGLGLVLLIFRRRRSGGGSTVFDSARARRIVALNPADETKVAEDASYRNARLEEFTELCNLATAACKQAGKQAVAPKVATIQVGMTLIMAGWGGIRSQIASDPMLTMHVLGVSILLHSTWKSLVGAVQFYGLKDGSCEYESEQKLLEAIDASAEMVMTMMEKWGLKMR